MALVLGYVQNGVVYMATSTRTIIGGRKRNDVCECCYRIKKCENGILIGRGGNTTVRQEIFAHPEIFTLDKKNRLTKKHIYLQIIPALLSMLRQREMLDKSKNGIERMDESLLVAYEGQLFEIGVNFDVLIYTRYQASGELSNMAFRGLDGIDETKDISKQLVQIMRNMETFSDDLGEPYLTINTSDKQFVLTEEETCI